MIGNNHRPVGCDATLDFKAEISKIVLKKKICSDKTTGNKESGNKENKFQTVNVDEDNNDDLKPWRI